MLWHEFRINQQILHQNLQKSKNAQNISAPSAPNSKNLQHRTSSSGAGSAQLICYTTPSVF